MQSWLYGLPIDYWDTYPAKMRGDRGAGPGRGQKYWDPASLQIVAVGDAVKITDLLKKLGTLEIYDADGKPVK